MRLRKRYLPLAAMMGAFVALLPAVADSETSPTMDAVNAGEYSHYWQPAAVTVGVGGVVAIRNATMVPHGVEWVGGPSTPVCSGIPLSTSAATSGTEWSGTCSFAQAGTYKFYCTVHGPSMTGTITVSAGGTTTTTTTTPTTTSTTSVPGSPVEPPAGVLLLRSTVLASIQRGGAVHGLLAVSQAGAGSRLRVDVLAKSGSLGKPRHATRVVVGSFLRNSVSAGDVAFRVRLDAAARRALKRARRLSLVVRITLTPTHGTPSSITRTVVEHA